eukprot:TRINITY_DN15406_c0_g1_i1.p1 TRINITY_DN15406_c0_g1~~TRINITY_DN15406_c0_g1_i1.p1  ORF type:complete len:906 (-),score=124.23 TRINITY_DN15406_c0_g1_i1:12-2729(-)
MTMAVRGRPVATPTNVRVYLRVRPFHEWELLESPRPRSFLCIDRQFVHVLEPRKDFAVRGDFVFDDCFDNTLPRTAGNYPDQSTIYQQIGTQLLENAFQGYNACLFAYGQTGTGKSYTMMGEIDTDHRGVIPRLCQDMFQRIEVRRSSSPSTFKVQVSYTEVYKEKVKDLLAPPSAEPLRVRQHPSLGTYVEGLSTHTVDTVDAILALMRRGDQQRAVASTKLNERSSRSHAIFSLIFRQVDVSAGKIDSEVTTKSKTSRINLVDLAGSERVKVSGVTGNNLEEAKKINLSLSTLGRVIDILADRQQAKTAVPPFRESLLTWILADSLGGNSKTIMIATVSPHPMSFDETLNTLRYASRAKCIVNNAIINEVTDIKLMSELQTEIAGLQERLRRQEQGREHLLTQLQMNEQELAAMRRFTESRERELMANASAIAEEREMLVEAYEKLTHEHSRVVMEYALAESRATQLAEELVDKQREWAEERRSTLEYHQTELEALQHTKEQEAAKLWRDHQQALERLESVWATERQKLDAARQEADRGLRQSSAETEKLLAQRDAEHAAKILEARLGFERAIAENETARSHLQAQLEDVRKKALVERETTDAEAEKLRTELYHASNRCGLLENRNQELQALLQREQQHAANSLASFQQKAEKAETDRRRMEMEHSSTVRRMQEIIVQLGRLLRQQEETSSEWETSMRRQAQTIQQRRAHSLQTRLQLLQELPELSAAIDAQPGERSFPVTPEPLPPPPPVFTPGNYYEEHASPLNDSFSARSQDSEMSFRDVTFSPTRRTETGESSPFEAEVTGRSPVLTPVERARVSGSRAVARSQTSPVPADTLGSPVASASPPAGRYKPFGSAALAAINSEPLISSARAQQTNLPIVVVGGGRPRSPSPSPQSYLGDAS